MGIQESYITADELFARVLDVVEAFQRSSRVINKSMHETLVLTCRAGLRNEAYGFGNLSSQVNTLCNRHKIAPREVVAIQRMRHDSNSSRPLSPDEVLQDCRALSLFISAVFAKSIPDKLLRLLPRTVPDAAEKRQPRLKRVRCTVREATAVGWKVEVDDDDTTDFFVLDIENTLEYVDFGYLRNIVHPGTQLNLLDCEVSDDVLTPRYVIVEPDFLIDISTLASCFSDYGRQPLQYILKQLKQRVITQYILLGNFAGTVLDDAINNEKHDMGTSLRRSFRENALEYVACADFDAAWFKQQAALQMRNIQQIAPTLFDTYSAEKAMLEPSFVCEELGLQGRVDLMTTDMRLLVEQKSGKNPYIEHNAKNSHGSLHIENHYVQLLLYYGILSRNFGLSSHNADIRLLYSKYPLPNGVLKVEPLDKLFREALDFRNVIVARQYSIARQGFESVFGSVMQQSDDIQRVLTPLERAYYCCMMTFVVREQLVQKVGNSSGQGISVADMWNMPLSEKRETGNIFTNLNIINKEASNDDSGYDMITLRIDTANESFLPNFRRGDMVYLYAYNNGEVPDVRRSVLHKGVIAQLTDDIVRVKLTNAQRNESILETAPRATQRYAIEHASSDIGTRSAMCSIHQLMRCSSQRRALLLAQRAPQRNESVRLSKSYHPNYDEIVLKAMQTLDYFLLVGPPGTGKTSMAMRFMVEEELQKNYLPPTAPYAASVLLTAYTNRAVDEICGMLVDANINFVRIGNEYSCDEKYRKYLLSSLVEQNGKLSALRQQVADVPVVVATTATLQSKPYIFAVRQFSLAIVDEASQILEPSIIGLLCQDAIKRFVLVGDYKQLPAVVQQSREESITNDPLLHDICLYDCCSSLFERLINIERKAHRTAFTGILHRQGRMHPDVACFTGEHFYRHENVMPVPLPHQQESAFTYAATPHDSLDEMLMTRRMVYIPSRFNHVTGQSDKVNEDEGYIVADLLERIHRYYGNDFDARKTVGVIVPYRNQIAMIRRCINEKGLEGMENVSIDTVERYQGSQRDIIIYNFTIQHRYQLDFLTSNRFVENNTLIDRKLNVALTRARRQTIIIGNEKTLAADPLFNQLITDIGSQDTKQQS